MLTNGGGHEIDALLHLLEVPLHLHVLVDRKAEGEREEAGVREKAMGKRKKTLRTRLFSNNNSALRCLHPHTYPYTHIHTHTGS